ncbi:uncharacterized protein [Dysidea avara]|uniref:uncharacterized protein isoform X4 n=1 Tax=Dysidea avara TaxID=196820 RepID=UPI00331FD98C
MGSRLLLVISIASILALSEETSILSATYSSLNVEITTTYQVPTSTVVPIESSTVIPQRPTSAEITSTVQVPSSTIVSIVSYSSVIPVPTSPGIPPTPTPIPVVCDEGDVRLVDRSTPSEGRIEICSSNTWLVVCDNPFNTERENRDRLICRQLGYANVLHKLRGLPQGSASYLLQDWNCTGTESNLLECASSDVTELECNVAGVACENVVDGCRIYPSYLNFDNDVCEETCPSGTFGVTNGTVNDLTTDRLRACTPIPAGFFILLNATQYEFDVDCNSPNGTAIFEASIILEDVNNINIVGARFIGTLSPYFLINGLSTFSISSGSAGFGSVISLTISLAQPLSCSSETSVLVVQLQTTAFDSSGNMCEDISDVIIYSRPSVCDPNPCMNNGTCADGINSFTCNCVDGFTGTNCETNTDDCNPNPCVNNGTCIDGTNSFTCSCVDGFTGMDCSINIDDCNPNPCMNNGTCTDGVNSFMCNCVDGFTGMDCSINIDDCNPNPCRNNGTCTDGVNSFTCNCVDGFTGIDCSINIDDCNPNPCINNGTCTDGVNSFTCSCVDGFTGMDCSINIDGCNPNPCMNNGTCTDGVNSFMCNCVDGFTGMDCSINIDDCNPNPCMNNGTCTDGVNSFMCNCVDGFTGMDCSINIDDCNPNPCMNNGTCTDGINFFSCSCAEGFTGNACETNTDFCSNNPCMNEAACINSSCVCASGFTGSLCETVVCLDYPTFLDAQRGECVETCPPGYYGVVSDSDGSVTRTCEQLPANISCSFNATHYEFDIDVNSPIGTLVFEALFFLRNPTEFDTLLFNFPDSGDDCSSLFQINGVRLDQIVRPTEQTLLNVTLNEDLSSCENPTWCQFQLAAVKIGIDGTITTTANVTLHKTGVCVTTTDSIRSTSVVVTPSIVVSSAQVEVSSTIVPSSSEPVPSSSMMPIPSSSMMPIPSSSLVPIPSSSSDPVPSSTMVPIPSSSSEPVPSSSVVPIPSSSSEPVPSSSVVPIPSSSEPVPSSTMVPIPSSSSSEPVPSSSIVPIPSSSSEPVPSSSLVPIPSSSSDPVPSSTMVPIPSSSSEPVPSSSVVPIPSSSSEPVPSSSVVPIPSSSEPVPSSTMVPIPSSSSSEPVPSSSIVPIPSSSSEPVPSSSLVPIPSSLSSSDPVPSSSMVPIPSSSFSEPVPSSTSVSTSSSVSVSMTPSPTPDNITVSFAQRTYTVGENVGEFTVEIVLGRSSSEHITVEVFSRNGTAMGGLIGDFVFTRASVTFAPGTMIATFTVDITDDSMVEPNENFIINIDQSSLPDGVVVVDPSQVTVTIVDNDEFISTSALPTSSSTPVEPTSVPTTSTTPPVESTSSSSPAITATSIVPTSSSIEPTSVITTIIDPTSSSELPPISSPTPIETPADLLITTQPMDQAVDIGGNVAITCEAGGGANPLSYIWLFNDNELLADPGHISGVDTTTLMITNVTVQDGGSYSCRVIDSDNNNVTSDEATLFINPSIITHPMSQLTQDGGSITFTCLAVGFPSPSYNWSTPSTTTDLMTSSIVFTASYNSYGDYTCAAGSNGVVVISDIAVLTVSPQGSVFILPSEDIMAAINSTVTLSCIARGGPNNVVEWRKDGVVISGANDLLLSIPIMTSSDGGVYQCTVSNAAGSGSASTTVVVIVPTLCFGEASQAIAEDEGSIIFTLTLSMPLLMDINITVITTDGTATGGDDYITGPYSLTLESGSASVSGQVRIIDDDLCDAPETFTLTIDSSSLPSDVTVPRDCQQVITIIDNRPSVSFDATMYTASETDMYSEDITVIITEPCLNPFYVVLINSADGSAEGGLVDYNSTQQVVGFNTNTRTAVIRYFIVDDNMLEDVECFNITLLPLSQEVSLGDIPEATVCITDNNDITVELSTDRFSGSENFSPLIIELELRGGTFQTSYDVNVMFSDITATGGIDYDNTTLVATFDVGNSRSTVGIPIYPDCDIEGDEEFTITLQVPPLYGGRVSAGTQRTAIGVISDRDGCVLDGVCYDYGEHQINCTTRCTCMADREFTCVTVPCSYDGPTCEVDGDPHYKTFDGYWHHFQGTCEYVLTKPCDGDDFIISAGNIGHEGSPVSCVGFVRIRIPSESLEILLERGDFGTISINGNPLGNDEVYVTDSVDVVRIGGYPNVFLKTRGVRLFFDGIYRAQVTVAKFLEGQLCGLCGTYNGTIIDDLQMPDGTFVPLPEYSESVTIDGAINDFGDSWLVPDSTNPECNGGRFSKRNAPGVAICSTDDAIVSEGQTRCSVLEQDPFTACHGVVNVTQYVANCEFDYCCCNETEREDCYCDALSSYASACADAGVAISNWRTADICPRPCPAGMTYQQCGPLCPQTCDNLDQPCEGGCAEGCFCPFGEVLLGGMCVNNSQCEGIPNVTVVGNAERNETALKDVTLSVTIDIGSSFTFTVQWYYNDQPITDDGNYTINTTSSSSSLTILTTVPSDTGTYRVDVTSSVGSDTVSFTVDIEAATVSFTQSSYSVNEGVGNFTATLTLSCPPVSEVRVMVLANSGTANGNDYFAVQTTATFAAGEMTAQLTFSITDDNILEDDETFTLTFDQSSLLDGVVVVDPSQVTVTIVDNDAVSVSFNQSTYTVNEDEGPAQPVLVLSNPSSSDITVVVISSDGSATGGGVDFGSGSYSVTFTAGVTTNSFDVPITDDTIVECDDETFDLTIQSTSLPNRVNVTNPSQATITIIDTTSIPVIFRQNVSMGSEASGSVIVTLDLVGGSSSRSFDVIVTPSEQSPVSAEGGVDFSTAIQTATFIAGATTSSVSISVFSDTIVEGDEMFDLTLTVPDVCNGRISAGNRNMAVGDITDNTTAVIDFAEGQFTGSESSGIVEVVVVKVNGTSSAPLDVIVTPFEQSPVSATGSGVDFDSNAITITIGAGSTEGRGNISVSCDNVVEGVETFDMSLTLASDNPLVRVGRDTSVGRITDSTVVVNIEPSSYETRESSSEVTLTLRLSQVSSEPFEVVLTTMDITATDGEDYNGGRMIVNISAGVLTQSFTIDIIDNDVVECDEVFRVTIESVTTCGVTTGDVISSNVTIMDDDEALVSLDNTEYSVSEDDGQLLVGVTLSRVTSQDVTILVTTNDGTTTGDDYNVTQQSLQIPAGSTSASIIVDIINDMIHEDDETFDITITLMTTCLAISVDDNVTTVTIFDDEVAEICFAETSQSVDEGEVVTYTLSSSVPSSNHLMFTIHSVDGTATGGDDYMAGPYIVTLHAGMTSVTGQVTTLHNGNIYERDETFSLTINETQLPTRVETRDNCVLDLTIVDIDIINITFDQPTYAVDEGVIPLVPTITLSNPASFGFSVSVLVEDRAATETDDYTNTLPVITIPAGMTSIRANPIGIVDDTIVEYNETFSISLSYPDYVIDGDYTEVTVTIIDNDRVSVRFTQDIFNGSEATGYLLVSLELLGGTVSIPFGVTVIPSEHVPLQLPECAEGDDDFNTTSQVARFEVGMTTSSVTISLTPIGDDDVEIWEEFDLSLQVSSSLFDGRITRGDRYTSTGLIIDPQSCIQDGHCGPVYGDFCKKECPANDFPPHTTLLQQPVMLNENAFVVIPSTRRPEFGDEFTFYASFSQAPSTTAYLLFYGTNATTINFAVQLDGVTIQGRTTLTIQYSNDRATFDIPLLSDGNEHCLLFTFPLIRVFVDDVQVDLSGTANLGFFELPASGVTENLGVTDPDAVNLLVGGIPPDVGYFSGTINQVAIFNGYLFANSSVCSLMDTSIVRYGRCTHYLTLSGICPPPTVESTEFCLEDLDRCDPSLRCFPGILATHTCQYVPPICTSDDDCREGSYCGEELPSYISEGYLESDASTISGEETSYISSSTKFDGLTVITRPATDHPDLDRDLTIFAILQQDSDNDGYVIAKGADRSTVDWALYLQSSESQITLSYRTVNGTTYMITFMNVAIADVYNHSVSAVIDGTNSRALLFIDGEIVGVEEDIPECQFQPGFNDLLIGGIPEGPHIQSVNGRFSGTISYLAVYNTALTYGEIAQLNSTTNSKFTLERYCREYIKEEGLCYLGDSSDYRCDETTECVPVVKNSIVVSLPVLSGGRRTTEQRHLTAQLPQAGIDFSITDVVGRCVTPCSCNTPQLSDKVCGADGRTYDSQCYADCVRVQVIDSTGPCALTYAELYRMRNP